MTSPRSMASAKAAGAWFERLIANYWQHHVDDRIDRRVKTGAADKGDIGGYRVHGGQRVVIECKEYGGRYGVGPWLREAEVERVNDGALACMVIAKRRGSLDPGDQVVFMTVRDVIALQTGIRPPPP